MNAALIKFKKVVIFAIIMTFLSKSCTIQDRFTAVTTLKLAL